MPPDTEIQLDKLSAKLLERMSKEESRPPTTDGTHLLGGVSRTSADLEQLLRAAIVVAAESERCKPESILNRSGGKQPSLRKTMIGPLAHGLRRFYAGAKASSAPEAIRPLLGDLLQ